MSEHPFPLPSNPVVFCAHCGRFARSRHCTIGCERFLRCECGGHEFVQFACGAEPDSVALYLIERVRDVR